MADDPSKGLRRQLGIRDDPPAKLPLPPVQLDTDTVLSSAELANYGYRSSATNSPAVNSVSDNPAANLESKFPWTEVVVGLFGGLLAEPFCHAGADALMSGHYLRGIVGFAIGLPIGAAAFSFHWWKKRIPAPSREWIKVQASRWWPLALLLAFSYVAGPEMYRRATKPVATNGAIGAMPIGTAPSQLCFDGPCDPPALKPGPILLKEIGLEVDQQRFLVLHAKSAATTDRLRVFVDYAEYRGGWMTRTRAFIGEFKEPVIDQALQIQLIYRAEQPNAGTNDLWWGDPKDYRAVSAFDALLPASIVRGRIAIVGSTGEQHHYFTLLRSVGSSTSYKVGVIPAYESEDWIARWERE